MKTRFFIVLCIAFVAMTLINANLGLDGVPSTDQILISVGNGNGAAGSLWKSSVYITNESDTDTATVSISFLKRGQENLNPLPVGGLQVGPGETLSYDDVVPEAFGVNGFGALYVASNLPVIASGRIYNDNATNAEGEHGTTGQWMNAISVEADRFSPYTDLAGLVQNNQFRSNVAVVETRGKPANFKIELLLGGRSQGIVKKTLSAYEANQWNVASLFPGVFPSDQKADVRIWSPTEETGGVQYGGKVIALGSVVDNITGDPSTVEMSFASWKPMEGYYSLVALDLNGMVQASASFSVRWDVDTQQYHVVSWHMNLDLFCFEHNLTDHVYDELGGWGGGLGSSLDFYNQTAELLGGGITTSDGFHVAYNSNWHFYIHPDGTVTGSLYNGVVGGDGPWADCVVPSAYNGGWKLIIHGSWVGPLDH